MASLLKRLALTPAAYAALPSDACERVVDFLLRWQDYTGALACLDALDTLAAAQLLQRAAALHGLGRSAEAIRLLETRLAGQPSLPAQRELLRLRLAAGQTEAALAVARQLAGATGENPPGKQTGFTNAPGALALGEALLAAGALGEAEAILLRLRKDAPASRAALLGLLHVEQRRGDVVSAAAYALRCLELARRGPELAVEEMLTLREALQRTGDDARVADLNRQLVTRFDRDLVQTKALLANARELAPARAHTAAVSKHNASHPLTPPTEGRTPAHPADRRSDAPSDWAPASPAAALSSVTVSAQERRELAQKAKELFGYKQLLPGQAEVLACARRGEHVLAVMPTAAGKSLCYQLPAFFDKNSQRVTLVVSPLVALMKDQIDGLPGDLRRQAIAVHSSLDGDDLRKVVERIAAHEYRLVYVAPERLRQLPFVTALGNAGIERLVVDEAHCVSMWGHDFRPDYLHLAQAHADLGGPPILAMTATAPPRVRHDIERQLLGGLVARQPGANGASRPAMRVLVSDTFRPNLHLTALRVRDEEEQQAALIDLLRQLPAPGIIYVRSRKRCEELAQMLVTCGVRASAYHAGLESRAVIQDQFMRNALHVIVATVAFGMGVDKPDIRFIIHCGLPVSVEGYYQEIGRAGRDGQPSHCVLLYSEGDRATLERLAGQDQLDEQKVRTAYEAIRQTLGAANKAPSVSDQSHPLSHGRGSDKSAAGIVPLAQLAAALRGSETEARMVLGALEQTGLIRRHYDAPQTLTIHRLPQRSGRQPDAGIQAFFAAANLLDHTTASGDFASLAAAAAIPLDTLEAHLLGWQSDGWLRYYPAGRAPLISLPTPPADAAQRVESLVTRRAAVAQSRVQEIDEYAHCSGCRHAWLGTHLGGPEAPSSGARCGVCDGCGSGLHLPQRAAAGPTPADLVLAALAEQSWGRRTLVHLLRGDPEAPDRAQAAAAYGCLRERSEQSLGQLIDSLIGEGLIARRALDHGGVTLEATPLGLESLKRSGTAKAVHKSGTEHKPERKPERKPASAHARWHKKG